MSSNRFKATLVVGLACAACSRGVDFSSGPRTFSSTSVDPTLTPTLAPTPVPTTNPLTCPVTEPPLGARTLLSHLHPNDTRTLCLSPDDWNVVVGGIHVKALDLVFVQDTTISMDPAIGALQSGVGLIAAAVRTLASDVKYGLAEFQDWGRAYGGDYGDVPFYLDQPLTSSIGDFGTSLAKLFAAGGGDIPESDLEALYQIATGEGDNGFVGVDPQPVGWRVGSSRVVILITDAPFKNIPADRGLTRAQVKAALIAKGIKVIGIAVDTAPKGSTSPSPLPPIADMAEFALATGAVAAHDIDLNGNGIIEPELGEFHKGDPLVFTFNPSMPNAATIAQIVTSGLTELVSFPVQLDVAGNISGMAITGADAPKSLHKGDVACFSVQLTLEAGLKLTCSAGEDRDLALSLRLQDKTLLKAATAAYRLKP